MSLQPGPTRALLEEFRAGREAAVAEETALAEDLEGGAAVGDTGDRNAEFPRGVVQEPVQILVLDEGVREQQDEIARSVFHGNALSGGPAGDPARELSYVKDRCGFQQG